MAKEIMRRKAADNPYLHPDFHGALSAGLEYLHDRYGEDAVRDYLRAFAQAFYAPLKDELRRRGLAALEDHCRRIYALEGGQIRLVRSEDELRLDVEACPAVTHMRAKGYPVARLFRETEASVDAAICEDTPFASELLEYDDQTGRSSRRFYRRMP